MSNAFKLIKLRDGNGRMVPFRLKEPFEFRSYYLKQSKYLQEWITRMRRTSQRLEIEDTIDFDKIGDLLRTIQYLIVQGLPYMICDCDGEEDCPKCKNRGWVSMKEAAIQGMFSLSDE